MSHPRKDIDLGLAILSAITPPGVRRSHGEIAAYCNCTRSNIQYIEERGLHKLRKALFMRNDQDLRELVEQVIGRPLNSQLSTINSP